jgi:hypothetical protein
LKFANKLQKLDFGDFEKVAFQSVELSNCGRPRMTPNGLQLQEVGDFYYKCSYEERMFVEPQNCHTKH